MVQVRVHNFSVSLDGFGTGEGQSLDAPFRRLRLLVTKEGCASRETALADIAAKVLERLRQVIPTGFHASQAVPVVPAVAAHS